MELKVELKRQLNDRERKHDAEECLQVFEALKEIYGTVWKSQWNSLINCSFIGNYPNKTRVYRLTLIGKYFLKGWEAEHNIRKEVK